MIVDDAEITGFGRGGRAAPPGPEVAVLLTPESMRIVVHLSDLHFGRVDPRLEPPLVRTIHAIAPDLIATSGDLTQRARRSQFEQARAFLQQLRMPTIVVPGNHDVPLFNIAARLVNPFAGYRRRIQRDLEPIFRGEEMIVVGLNSARTIPFNGAGTCMSAMSAAAPSAIGLRDTRRWWCRRARCPHAGAVRPTRSTRCGSRVRRLRSSDIPGWRSS
jgi:3',5'-cyclic AMP phosphodiesterase CpdA